jgi:hypothetical protein
MKIKAFTLLLCFFAYFVSGFAAANCSEVKPMKTMCCKRMAAKHQVPRKCPKQSGNNDNCYNCSLTYIATLITPAIVSIHSVAVEREFSLLQNDELTGFPSTAWKPPNA